MLPKYDSISRLCLQVFFSQNLQYFQLPLVFPVIHSILVMNLFVKELLTMWAYESVFYQIYPIGFCGAPRVNDGVLKNRISKVAD